MSMLRFVLRKINVMHNSLIKFWSVIKSNEGASLFQSIAQTKAKLQLNEAGAFSNWFYLLVFLLFVILISSAVFFVVYIITSLVVPSIILAAVSLLGITGAVYVRNSRKLEFFASTEFIIEEKKLNGTIEFYDSDSDYANGEKSSRIVENFKKLEDNNKIIHIECDIDKIHGKEYYNYLIVESICDNIFNMYGINISYYVEKNEIKVLYKREEEEDTVEKHTVFVSWHDKLV